MIITLQTLVFFRESFLNALDRLLRPYYEKFSLVFGRNGEVSEDDESDEQVFAEFDEERGVVFYPPMYLQRYAAVSDCLMDERWCGKLEKVVDLGYHDMSFIKYLKEVQGIKCILGVDIESIPLRCSLDLLGCDEYGPKRENPLEVTLFKGNAADPDYRLIGCDAVIAIEMIEHMLPHDLDRLIHTVFGFIKPRIAIFTTPNGDFNILFKALEKNGLRRLDHFFEWSQDQFHDWCSNIIVRYPEYTVSCRGIGPGPVGTKHLGCCSQMALFVAKEYNKQQDLNLNSLALVADTPSPNSISNLMSWESIEMPNESNMIEPPKNNESYSDLSYPAQRSSITIVLTSPSCSVETIMYQDKTSQCNLDSETERSYLMFDYEQMFDVLIPRRHVNNRVYDFEDVYNRLNCTTLQVNKFSKTTQNLMAKNKVDSLVHTREVVDEIRHLTKMLNFNKECNNQLENGVHTWSNINWGDNAPYWNQYYTVVKQYNYPFEIKSEECRILDLISDEINRLIDTQFDEDVSSELNKLEIPIEHLMNVVEPITDDVVKVKDLLEWNGYEVVDNMVIHSRLVVDYSSVGTQEDDSQETDLYSDWDSTDIRSTSMSDGSTMVPDYQARCLRRALDQKVRKLRSMLTADEDITTELDQVVCRLLKLALRTSKVNSKGRTTPPPTRWMQCKLLDLLTLTEKAIERRRRHFIESYPLKAINCEEKSEEMTALEKIKGDNTALKIVDKYQHLVNQPTGGTEESSANDQFTGFYLEDDMSVSTAEYLKDYEYMGMHNAPKCNLPETTLFHTKNTLQGESKLKRTQAWVEEDIEEVPYPDHEFNLENSSVEIDQHATKFTKYYKTRYNGKQCVELKCVICKKSHSKAFKQNMNENRSKDNLSKTKLVKKMSRKESRNKSVGLNNNNKYVSVDYKTYKVKPRRKQHRALYPTAAKPIPASLIELCHPEFTTENYMGLYNNVDTDVKTYLHKDVISQALNTEISATKESLLIDIVTDDNRETIALRRNIGTDADIDPMSFEDETLIRSVSNTVMNEDDMFAKHDAATDDLNSQTIFLYDINEPTTSKGIRHVSMDVQCGPDATERVYSTLSATTSLIRMPKLLKAGIDIGDTATDCTCSDCCTCTYGADYNHKTIEPQQRSIGIKIKDSDSNLVTKMEYFTMPAYTSLPVTMSLTRMPKMFTAGIKIAKSISDAKIKNIGCNKCTCNVETNFENTTLQSKTAVNKFKDFGTNHTETVECSTNTKDASQCQNCNETTVLKRTLIERPIDIQIKSSVLNLPLKIECSTTKSHVNKSQDKCTLPQKKPKQKGKSVGFIFKNSTLKEPKETNEKTNTRASHNKPRLNTSSQKSSNKPMVLKRSKRSSDGFNIKDTGSICTQKIESTTNTDANSNTLTPFRFSNKRAIEKEMSDEITVTYSNLNHLEHNITYPTNTQDFRPYTSSPQPFSEGISVLTSPSSMKIGESVFEIPESVGSSWNFPSPNSLQKTDLQVISAINTIISGSRHPSYKFIKPNLCNGGVQIHSYRDKQTVSEDIMYQGEWQRHRPKIVTKRKIFNPIISKRTIDSNLKKKTSSEEKIHNKNSVNFRRKIINKNLIKSDGNQVIKRHLLTRNDVLSVSHSSGSKSKISRNEIKQTENPPVTLDITEVTKSLKNVLKVTSKFPVSSVPTKNPKYKVPFVVKKSTDIPNLTVTKDDTTYRKNITKNYIPVYLRQRKTAGDLNKSNLKSSFDSVSLNIKNDTNTCKQVSKTLIRSKIQPDLLKLITKAPPNKQYLVLRNEIDLKNSRTAEQQIENTERVRNRDGPRQRSLSPNSQTSSTCSSPSSIATVKAVSTRPRDVANHRHSASLNIGKTSHIKSDNTTTLNRYRKFSKTSKSAKTTGERTENTERDSDNKENIPQSSKQINFSKNESVIYDKRNFIGQNKEVCIAHIKENSPLQPTVNTLSKLKTQKSNVNIPTVDSISEKKASPVRSPSPTKRASSRFEVSLSSTRRNEVSDASQTSNVVLVIEPQARKINTSPETPTINNVNVVNHRLVLNLDNSDKESGDTDNVTAIRVFIDEILDFINEPFDKECSIDSETVILSSDNLDASVVSSASATSFKTVVTNSDNYNGILQSDIEYVLNRSFDTTLGDESIMSMNDTRLTITDLDVLSIRSFGSRFSGYISDGNELTASNTIMLPASNTTSVHDIYERKDQPFQPTTALNPPGALANQAFSGFSIDGDPVAGDQPEFINFVDSETGSLAVDVNRQATSEELFVSGRSSDSFQSCVLDEDSVVPNWLFQILSQQQSIMNELEPPVQLMDPLPVAEPMFDDNGNVMEVPGLGAGAGDGRGIHSDQSQDSSGQGTSVSSSETSSGPQSEAILIDPSAFVAQFELLRDAVESSVIVVAVSDPTENLDHDATSSRPAVGLVSHNLSHGEACHTATLVPAHVSTGSDVDADVSSLDTDVPDSSDN